MSLYQKIANSHPSLARGKVWCRKCGNEKSVNPSNALRNGWPECCGQTMTIDSPEEQKGGIGKTKKWPISQRVNNK